MQFQESHVSILMIFYIYNSHFESNSKLRYGLWSIYENFERKNHMVVAFRPHFCTVLNSPQRDLYGK